MGLRRLVRLLFFFVLALTLALTVAPTVSPEPAAAAGESAFLTPPSLPSPGDIGRADSVDGIGFGDPTAEVDVIAPPTPNASGAAKLSYPLDLPGGRGMSSAALPKLALTYNSSSRGGWVGQGWSLGAGEVSVDTAFGVPRFCPSAGPGPACGNVESEAYQISRDPTLSDSVADSMESLRADLEASVEELRRTVAGVMPTTLLERGLYAAMEDFVATVPLHTTLTLPGRREHLPATIESAAYYVVTEAVTNVLKHAHAHTLVVDLGRAGDTLTIAVRDDGVGGVSAAKARRGGLSGLADRVGALGGRFEVESTPNVGTTTDGGGAMRVVIGEDEALMRQGLTLLMDGAGFDVVSTVGDADSLVQAADDHGPDLVVTDIRMPPDHRDEGLRAALRIKHSTPTPG